MNVGESNHVTSDGGCGAYLGARRGMYLANGDAEQLYVVWAVWF